MQTLTMLIIHMVDFRIYNNAVIYLAWCLGLCVFNKGWPLAWFYYYYYNYCYPTVSSSLIHMKFTHSFKALLMTSLSWTYGMS